MRTLSAKELLIWIRWYRRHRRTASFVLTEDVPGTRNASPAGPDPEPEVPDTATARPQRRR